MPSIVKKRMLREEYKKHLVGSSQKTEATQTSRLVSADRIEQVKKTKFELEHIKIKDCFIHYYGICTSKLQSSQKTFPN